VSDGVRRYRCDANKHELYSRRLRPQTLLWIKAAISVGDSLEGEPAAVVGNRSPSESDIPLITKPSLAQLQESQAKI